MDLRGIYSNPSEALKTIFDVLGTPPKATTLARQYDRTTCAPPTSWTLACASVAEYTRRGLSG